MGDLRDLKRSKNELAVVTFNRRVAKQALGQRTRPLVDRHVSSVPALWMHEPVVAVLPITRGRRGRASVRAAASMEKRGLLPTVAILSTSRNSMPGSPGLLSKMRPFPLPLLQQNGALYSASHGQIQLCLHCWELSRLLWAKSLGLIKGKVRERSSFHSPALQKSWRNTSACSHLWVFL